MHDTHSTASNLSGIFTKEKICTQGATLHSSLKLKQSKPSNDALHWTVASWVVYRLHCITSIR